MTSDLTDGYDARNTVGEVYEQILSDLTDAEECFLALPEDKRHPESYRINLPAVQLIRARVALHMGDMEEAAAYASKVINDWDLELYDLNSYEGTYSNPYPNFTTLDNPEMIWTMEKASGIEWQAKLEELNSRIEKWEAEASIAEKETKAKPTFEEMERDEAIETELKRIKEEMNGHA